MTGAPAPYDRAVLALCLLAADPAGLGGLWLRARAGPVRDRLLAALDTLPLPVVRLHPGMAAAALEGGLDLAATLAGGLPVQRTGQLAQPSVMVLAMAERCPPGLAARLARVLDEGRHALIALDEGAEEGEALAPVLAERLAFFADLDCVAWGDSRDSGPFAAPAAPQPYLPPEALDALARTAALAGIGSLRAPLLAAAAARASARRDGRAEVTQADLRLAAALTLAHRALPEAEPPAEDPPSAPAPLPDRGSPEPAAGFRPKDLLLAAVRAALPADLLARLAAGRAARGSRGTAGTGASRRGNRRGRPLPARPGHPDGRARIDLVPTLRAAAPWQRLRRAAAPAPRLLHLRGGDIRLKATQETSDRVLIFAVDASGSAAVARLAEAKGAVELLLARAYARRDHVALVAFRGTSAEVLLPPTRSLVQAKRRLAALPGGGGTPLAAGLEAALALALLARARGLTPTLALLTDGRPNIGRGGDPGRPQAEADAEQLARAIRARRIPALVLDTGNRPVAWLSGLARQMGAVFLALPRADARRLSDALAPALGG